MKKIIILFSGNGTNLEKIIDSDHNHVDYEVVGAIASNSVCKGIKRAEDRGVPVSIVDSVQYKDRLSFDIALSQKLQEYDYDLIVFAGFMRILTQFFFTQERKIVNIHPSVLPAFKGYKALRRSFNSETKDTGISIHWVTKELDEGKIIKTVPLGKLTKDETYDEFKERIQQLEHKTYPEVIANLIL